MKHKKYLSSLFLVLLTFGTIGIVIWFTKSPHFPLLNVWVQNNYTFYLTGLYLVKVFGIVWPPLSGGIFTVASIPFLGWKLAFIIDFLGSATGSVITYYFANKIFSAQDVLVTLVLIVLGIIFVVKTKGRYFE